MEFGPGIGLPGRAFAPESRYGISDITMTAISRGRRVAAHAASRRMAFPVLSGEESSQCWNFSPASLANRTWLFLDVLSQDRFAIGSAIERQRAEIACGCTPMELARRSRCGETAGRANPRFLQILATNCARR